MKNKGVVTCKSPSNIALVKYWGKKPIQIPMNPSISFSLSHCHTETRVKLLDTEGAHQGIHFTLLFDGHPKPAFEPKIATFLERIKAFIPRCLSYTIVIASSNSFPHSSGIASSASSMSALAGCLREWERILNDGEKDVRYYQDISEMARLGSGSAARSIEGGFSIWGYHANFEQTSDQYAIQVKNIHPNFQQLQDTILLVDKGVKKVSSTVGHDLMNNHPFAEQRFIQARQNINQLLEILAQGDFFSFAILVEEEALSLHAMMLTSHPSYLLFRPNTIAIIEKIKQQREENNMEICFTLDAGANVHLIYPKAIINNVLAFIDKELVGYCENAAYICDEVGEGQVITTKLNA